MRSPKYSRSVKKKTQFSNAFAICQLSLILETVYTQFKFPWLVMQAVGKSRFSRLRKLENCIKTDGNIDLLAKDPNFAIDRRKKSVYILMTTNRIVDAPCSFFCMGS